MMKSFWQKYFGYVLGLLLAIAVLIGIASYHSLADKVVPENSAKATVYFLDVGQGDAELIETGKDQQVLIDGGPGSAVLTKLGEVMPYYDKTIETVVLSHPDADHLRGLIDVLKRYEVKRVIEFKVNVDKQIYTEWKNLIQEKQIEDLELKNGDKVDISSDAKLDIVFPYADDLGKTTQNLNDSSLVCQLVVGDVKFLFTGDAEKEEIDKIISKEGNIQSQIYKVGHHGSRNATTADFLEHLWPEVAVISVGAGNSYGHPNQEVLSLLDLYAVKTYRTDKNGTVKISTDGKSYKVDVQK